MILSWTTLFTKESHQLCLNMSNILITVVGTAAVVIATHYF